MRNLLTSSLVAICLCSAAHGAEPIPIDGTAAVVNEKAISMTQVMLAMQPVHRLLVQKHSGEELTRELEAAYERTLNSLIERRLILDEYKAQQKFVIPDNMVDMQIDEILHTKFDNNRAKLMKTLEADGISMDDWRREMKERMIVSFMRNQALDTGVTVSPQAVRDAYEQNIAKYSTPSQVELRMIVINKGNTEQAMAVKNKQAGDVRKRLLAGENFDELAKQVSEGTKAAAGGYWGWIEPDSRRAELAAVLKTLDPGKVSEIIEAGDVYYILKIEARKHASVTPFEEVQESIREDLRKKETQRAYDSWIERLKKKAYIKKF